MNSSVLFLQSTPGAGLHLNSSSNKLDRLEEMETTEMTLSTEKEV